VLVLVLVLVLCPPGGRRAGGPKGGGEGEGCERECTIWVLHDI
jgi:hypothetical protein